MSKVIIDVTDRSKNVYFDTSIYNRLLDDPEKDRLIKLIKEKGFVVIPSVVNLCELLMTSASSRKNKLIRVYNEIRDDMHPLKPFVWLLKESVEAVQNGLDEWEISYPIEMDKETESICREIIALKSVELEPYLRKARDYIQNIAKKEAITNELQFFAYFDSENGQNILLGLLDQICTTMSIVCQLDGAKKLELISSPSSPWKYYLESYAYLFYRRAFPGSGYGKGANPGPSDLEQCTYLFWTGFYVIEDARFIEFLRCLKAIRNYPVEIMNYSEFKQFPL